MNDKTDIQKKSKESKTDGDDLVWGGGCVISFIITIIFFAGIDVWRQHLTWGTAIRNGVITALR